MTAPNIDLEPVKRLLAAGNLDAAWDSWKALDAAHPNSPEIMHLEGFILLQKGDWEGAVKAEGARGYLELTGYFKPLKL